MNFISNLTSASVDLSCYSQDLAIDNKLNKSNYIIDNFLEDNNNISEIVYSLENVKKLVVERPHIQHSEDVKIDNENKIVEYTFECSKLIDSIYELSLYFFSENIISLDDILKIQVFSLPSVQSVDKKKVDMNLLEEISREFLACWFVLFKQRRIKKELFLPIFLNRYNLYYYNLRKYEKCTQSQLIIKLQFQYNSNFKIDDYKNAILLYYRTQLFSNSFKKNLEQVYQKNSKDYYMYYDRVCDYSNPNSENKKWFNLKSNYTTIDIGKNFNEQLHRISDIFLVVRYKNWNSLNKKENKKVVEFISAYFEETMIFKFPSDICGNLISPISKNSDTNNNQSLIPFAPEIKELYYLPFSSSTTLFKEYVPRSYLCLDGIANMSILMDINKEVNEENFELCLIYISPTKSEI